MNTKMVHRHARRVGLGGEIGGGGGGGGWFGEADSEDSAVTCRDKESALDSVLTVLDICWISNEDLKFFLRPS